eukprot:2836859-Prymnesium_polylepis.1
MPSASSAPTSRTSLARAPSKSFRYLVSTAPPSFADDAPSVASESNVPSVARRAGDAPGSGGTSPPRMARGGG